MGIAGILRHGETNYTDLNPIDLSYENKANSFSVEEFMEISQDIKDITNEDQCKQSLIAQLQENSEYINEKKIAIRISPTARTIHTARILISALDQSGHLEQVRGISLYPQLGEVGQFTWTKFSTLVNGGVTTDTYTQEEVAIPKAISNPKNLGYADYFRSSARENIEREQLPGNTEHLQGIESYESIIKRSQRTLAKILNMTDNKTLVICNTHQALSDWITAAQKLPDQDKGAFIFIEQKDFDGLKQQYEKTI